MKRIVLFATVIFGLLIAGLIALPYLVSAQTIRLELEKRILELTGSNISYKGEPELSLIPYLGLRLDDVVLAGERQSDNERALVRMDNLQLGLNVIPLLSGKASFSSILMTRPIFNILEREDGSSNWANGAAVADLGNDSGGNVELGRIEIIDGILDIRNDRTDTGLRISNLEAIIDWPNLSSAWDIAGQGVWRGEVVEFSSEADLPLTLISSGSTDLAVKISSPSMAIDFDGQATKVTDIQLQGDAKIATPSLTRLSGLLRQEDTIAASPVGSLSIEGELFANAGDIRFEDAKVEMDANSATGNLQFRWSADEIPKVSGTLAFSSIDLTPFIEVVSNPATNDISPVSEAEPSEIVDLDVRFSADSFKINKNTFGPLAATLRGGKNDWAFEVGEAEMFGGMAIATITSKTVEGQSEIELKGILRSISMGDITRDWYGAEIFATGKADVNFDLKAPGSPAPARLRDFFGSMEITLTDGQIEGIDLVKAIPALNSSNGFVTVDEIKGSTPFSNLSLDLLIYNGVGWITKGNAIGDNNEFRLSGKADLLRGGLAVYTDIRRAAATNSRPQQTRIFIGGTVKNPLVMRSPLLDNRPDERVPTDG